MVPGGKEKAKRKGTAGEVRGEELEPRAGRWHLLCREPKPTGKHGSAPLPTGLVSKASCQG